MSIFISIASYRDPELMRTINSAIDNADNPEDLVFGIVLQDFVEDVPGYREYENMKIIKMHPKYARGAGYARAKAMELYDNEDYYLQIDSHTIFEKGWDSICIKQHNKAKELSKNDKIILSYFPPPFFIENKNKISFPIKDRERVPRPTKQWPILTDKQEWTAKRVELSSSDLPEVSATVLAGFIFTTGNIVSEVPYDPEIAFFGEEICFAMRAWTRGWDIYSPSQIILYHFYSREGYKKIWKDRNLRATSWKEIENISTEKQKNVLCGIEQGVYGAGNYRHLKLYEKFCGIDFKKIYDLTNQQDKSTISIKDME